MSEPRSWLEEGAPRDVEHLLRAAQAERPFEASLARALSALGIGLGVTGAAARAGAAGAAASSGGMAKVAAPITAGLLAKWGALGAALGTVAVGVTTIVRDEPRVAQPPALATPSPARLAPEPTRAAPLSPEPPVTAPSSVTSAAEQARTPRAGGGAPAGAAESSRSLVAPVPDFGAPINAETLAEEVRSVDRARAALAAGRAPETLAVLDEYERRYPGRRFAPEALYLRMEALVSLGRTARARAAAERLLASYPNSPQRARAREVLSNNP